MLISEYIKDNRCGEKSKLYFKKLEEIKQEFINRDLEYLLLTTWDEEISCMMKTGRDLDKLKYRDGFKEINNLFDSISEEIRDEYKEKDTYTMFFSSCSKEKYYIACELANSAYKHIILPNIFEDDKSVNHKVVFKKEQKKEIALMLKLISSYMQHGFSGYKIYDTDIKFIENLCLFEGKKVCYPKPNNLTHFLGDISRSDNDPIEILHARNVINKIMEKGYFDNEFELVYFLRGKIMTPMQNKYEKIDTSSLEKINYLEEKALIQKKMILNDEMAYKWKSEINMFKVICKKFKDATHQYRPEWLNGQTLDVFVPSINLAFEYQGQQHFKSVDFFGGEETLEKNKLRDKKKKRLCDENNVKLIYWNYDEPITTIVLKKKLKENNVEL